MPAAALARFLIGKQLVRHLPEGLVTGRIVETEAYIPGDAASHAYRGRTKRNASLFLEVGHAYIYLAYGISYMVNVSAEPSCIGGGVLIRAIEPVDGIGIMRLNRGVERLTDIARGPGRLAAALRVDLRLDGTDLCQTGPLWLARGDGAACDIGESVRIGITRDAARKLRYFVRGNGFVSGPRSLNR